MNNNIAPQGDMDRICTTKAEWGSSIDEVSEEEGWSAIWGGRKADDP